ncbi:hypothetical protein DITRI_Ditri03aG0114300 [Diplodiscus trichospermus]
MELLCKSPSRSPRNRKIRRQRSRRFEWGELTQRVWVLKKGKGRFINYGEGSKVMAAAATATIVSCVDFQSLKKMKAGD